MNAVPRIVLKLMAQLQPGSCPPVYRHALLHACDEFPPPFGAAEYGDVYREAATDSSWLAVSLITNADREADGAGRLWSLAACTTQPAVAAQIKQHAIDESNHAKIYLRIVDLVFEGAVEADFRAELDALSPGFTQPMRPEARPGSPYSHAITLDDLIQMNIAEIRTTIHHLLQRPMLRAHCPRASHPALDRLLNRLLREEIRHVSYTAKLIESYAANDSADVVRLFCARVQDFNEVTRAELAQRVFDVT